ncbi:protein of unknown function [Rhodovastum atsumiense]|nr:protein of unknown function [Rhodovastum atsumiense]
MPGWGYAVAITAHAPGRAAQAADAEAGADNEHHAPSRPSRVCDKSGARMHRLCLPPDSLRYKPTRLFAPQYTVSVALQLLAWK